MITPAEVNKYFEARLGSDAVPLLLARDDGSPMGWRPWTAEDTEALSAWIAEKTGAGGSGPDQLGCFNAKEAAALLGVSTHTLQGWLRRRQDPLPHLRDGRRIIIPRYLLRNWLTAEAERNVNDQPP